MGVYVFARIHDWRDWVHRRVEHIDFSGTVTYQRRISIDFTLPFETTGLTDSDGGEILPVPLALLSKRRLRNFSLRDDHGRTLPLLTRQKNGAVATSVLLSAARDAAIRSSRFDPSEETPRAVYEDLWRIANSSPQEALEVLEHFPTAHDPEDSAEARWRGALSEDAPFQAIAFDLATTFLVLTVVRDHLWERRVMKLEYEEQGQAVGGYLSERRRRRRSRRQRARALRSHRRLAASQRVLGGRGTLIVSVTGTERSSEDTRKRSRRRVDYVEVEALLDGVRVDATVTDRDGNARFELLPGHYEVQIVPPDGVIEARRARRRAEVRRGAVTKQAVACRPSLLAAILHDRNPETKPIKLRRRIQRSIGWRARPVAFLTPSVGHCSSFHLEIEAPEGLKLTRAKLATIGLEGQEEHSVSDMERGPLQRTHLYLDEVPQSDTAIALLHLRPRASLMVRMGTLSAAVTTAILAVIVARHSHLTGVVGSVTSLLLFVPGGLSAYTARPRENPLTSSVVFGLRLLTVIVGALSLIAAFGLLLARSWVVVSSTVDGRATTSVQPGKEWDHMGSLLTVLSAVSGAITLTMILTWYCTWRMPERRAA